MNERNLGPRPYGMCGPQFPERGPYSFPNGTYPPPPPYGKKYNIPSANYNFIAQQADWAQQDDKSVSFICNKPNFPVTINGIEADSDSNIELDSEAIGIGAIPADAIYEAVAYEFELEPEPEEAYCSTTCNCQGGE